MAPLLTGDAAKNNHEAIWALIAALPAEQLQASGNPTLDGWITLAQAVKGAGTLEQQQAAIDTWRAQNQPPGRRATADAVDQTQGTGQPAAEQDRPAAAAGWPAGLRCQRRYAKASWLRTTRPNKPGRNPPVIEFYDSSRLTSLDDFYAKAKAAGVQLVVGPLENRWSNSSARARNCRLPPGIELQRDRSKPGATVPVRPGG